MTVLSDQAQTFTSDGHTDSMVTFFQQGWHIHAPIHFAYTIFDAIALERYIKLTYVRHVNRRMWDKMPPMLTQVIAYTSGP